MVVRNLVTSFERCTSRMGIFLEYQWPMVTVKFSIPTFLIKPFWFYMNETKKDTRFIKTVLGWIKILREDGFRDIPFLDQLLTKLNIRITISSMINDWILSILISILFYLYLNVDFASIWNWTNNEPPSLRNY